MIPETTKHIIDFRYVVRRPYPAILVLSYRIQWRNSHFVNAQNTEMEIQYIQTVCVARLIIELPYNQILLKNPALKAKKI